MLPACQCHDHGYCLLVINVLLLQAGYFVSNDFVDASTNLFDLSAVSLWMSPQIC
jgi:hypothetical protein